MPTVGAGGVTGCAGITAFDDAPELQPDDCRVTIKLKVVPAANPLKVAVAVLPVIVAPPGLAVTVQLLVGNPLSATLPVANAQVGLVMAPTVGAAGIAGCAGITAPDEGAEVQPDDSSVTVNVCVELAGNPLKVAVAVLPLISCPLGAAVTVQLLAGKLLKATLPVATVQVGGVTVPTVGTAGVTGCAGITALVDAPEIQPDDCSVVVNV